MKTKFKFHLFAIALIIAFKFNLSGATRSWIGGTNNSWTTNSNWSGGIKPGASDDVILNGTGTYQPTTNISGTIRSLSINDGSLTLTGNLTITNYVIFYKGIINTSSTNLLIFNSGATVSGASDSSHVNGPVRKKGNAYGAFTFPTGNGVIYASIRVSSVTGSSSAEYFTAQYFKTVAPYSLTSKDASLNNISTLEYWNLTGGDLSAVVTLSFKSSRSGTIANITDLRVARWDGSKWKNHGGSATGTTSLGTVATTSTLSVFGPFALSSSSNLNPLPVELIEFTAVSVNKVTNLSWSTTSEENLHAFEICRSTDGQNYLPIGRVDANFNSNDQINYNFTDVTIAALNYAIVYYRLKMIDKLGSFKLSNISQIRVTELAPSAVVNIYPNPTSEFLNISFTSSTTESDITVNIINSFGQTVQTYRNTGLNSIHSITCDVSDLENGIYFINVLDSDGQISINKFIKK